MRSLWGKSINWQCHETQAISSTISNPFKHKCTFPLSGKVQEHDPDWPWDVFLWFSRKGVKYPFDLIPISCLCCVFETCFWSTQTYPQRGETFKLPLKLHCNHTQLKTTSKCLPYASKPTVFVLVIWRDIIVKRMTCALIEELSRWWLLLPVSATISIRAAQLSVCLMFDKCLMQHRP